MARVIIAGSRDGVTQADVDRAMEECPFAGEITQVLSGTARGADRFGEDWARRHGHPIWRFPADWQLGKRAGHLRNTEMSKVASGLVLVWDGSSRGSQHMLMEAAKRGLKIHQKVVRNDPGDD